MSVAGSPPRPVVPDTEKSLTAEPDGPAGVVVIIVVDVVAPGPSGESSDMAGVSVASDG